MIPAIRLWETLRTRVSKLSVFRAKDGAAPWIWDRKLRGEQTGGRPWVVPFKHLVCALSWSTRIAFLGAAVVFPHFGPKGTKGLFRSWTGSCVIFRNKFQQNHAMLMERGRKVSLPWLLGQDLVAPRPQVVLERSGLRSKLSGLTLRRPHLVHRNGGALAAALSPGAYRGRKQNNIPVTQTLVRVAHTGHDAWPALHHPLHSMTVHLCRPQTTKTLPLPAFSQPNCFLEVPGKSVRTPC